MLKMTLDSSSKTPVTTHGPWQNPNNAWANQYIQSVNQSTMCKVFYVPTQYIQSAINQVLSSLCFVLLQTLCLQKCTFPTYHNFGTESD